MFCDKWNYILKVPLVCLNHCSSCSLTISTTTQIPEQASKLNILFKKWWEKKGSIGVDHQKKYKLKKMEVLWADQRSCHVFEHGAPQLRDEADLQQLAARVFVLHSLWRSNPSVSSFHSATETASNSP